MASRSPKRKPRLKLSFDRDLEVSPPANQRPNMKRISVVIPDDIKILIADVILSFASLETFIEGIIWDLTGLRPDEGRLLTRMQAKDKFTLTKKLFRLYGLTPHPDKEIAKKIWTSLRQITEDRNKIAHGLWVVRDGRVGVSISSRLPTELGHITGEEFTKRRLKKIKVDCDVVRTCFWNAADAFLTSQSKPEALDRWRKSLLPGRRRSAPKSPPPQPQSSGA